MGYGKKNTVYDDLNLSLMLKSEEIGALRTEIGNVKKMCGWYGPSEVGGIDYSNEHAHITRISFDQGVLRIDRLNAQIKELEKEKRSIRSRIKRIRKIHSELPDQESRVFYQRIILKNTQQESANNLNISERQLQRIEKQMKARGVI